ncbi:hypothetical protein GOBAR_AA32656 [Gossypium barbadense]|uniref:Uncharacterized protein n=1 Tax=Gossypium barbadense TaxID=3634 RepID=A0A2P5WAE2_GOSBA|nr:hypothetical protein GOBAR_AA32656 [Gossypium barbadense]
MATSRISRQTHSALGKHPVSTPPVYLTLILYNWSKSHHYTASDQDPVELSSGQKVGRLQLFDITHRKKDGSPMTSEAGEIMEKLNDKKAEYEAIALNDSSDRERVEISSKQKQKFTHTAGSKSFACVAEAKHAAIHAFGESSSTKVQRLKDQMAQMQARTVAQIAQLKVEAASIKAEVQRKYEELQLQLKKEAAAREAEQNKKYNELQL